LDSFLEPRNASQIPYQSYKWFYRLPYPLTGTAAASVPVEGGIPPCTSSATTGNLKIQNIDRQFWICGTSSVYWDTNENGNADIIVSPRSSFSISTSNFFLNYIDANDKIRVSFRQEYSFNDFVRASNPNFNKMFPINDDKNKILLSQGFWDVNKERPRAGIIFNQTSVGKAVWVADFGRDGLSSTGDDHKQLLASLVLSTSNRKLRETFQQTGVVTSYINVNAFDMFEIYEVLLSIGSPF
jgi:hypothetical protein